jgi:hypothetical protein
MRNAVTSPFIWEVRQHQTVRNGHRTWTQYEPRLDSRSLQVASIRDDNNTTNLSTINLYLLTTTILYNQKQAPLQPPKIGN